MSTQRTARKPRTRPLIDSVRAATLQLVNCNSYLPATLVRRAKMAAIDRDSVLRMINDTAPSASEWPAGVVPISGMSGVIAQVLSDHFAALDAGAGQPAPAPTRKRSRK